MKKVYLSLLILCLGILSGKVSAQVVFSYTGSFQAYTVPTGVTLIKVDMAGAQGGNSGNGMAGGKGGRIQSDLAVTPGQVLRIYVGGKGNNANYTNPGPSGGYNGGGSGTYGGGAGGGATDIRISPYGTGNRVAVGGGGGGGGANCGEIGADAGGTNGANGINCGSYDSYSCGAGGTQSTGGAGAAGGGSSGGAGFGGNCAGGGYWYYGYWGTYYYYYYYYGGGGGSGYFGGGGGQYGSGGGGSSYPVTGATTTYCTAVTNTSGYQNGNGYVILTPPTIIATPGSLAFGNVTTGTTSVPPKYFVLSSPFVLSGGAITITPPSNFSISLDGITWSTSAITYTYTGTSFAGQNVYVRFTPSSSGSSTGNIVLSGGGAQTVNVAVSGNGASTCSGAPTAGSAVSSVSAAGSSTAINLSLTGVSSSGDLYYQWQTSPNNTTWTNIEGAIDATYTQIGVSANTYFRCIVSCKSGGSNNSSSVLVSAYGTTPAASSCTPTFGTGCTSGTPMYSSIGTLTGIGGTLSDVATNCGSNPKYIDNTSLSSTTLAQGGTYTANLSLSTSDGTNFATQIWIDFDDNGSFSSGETVGGIAYGGVSTPSSQPCTITIPSGANVGTHRMRVMSNYYPPCCYGSSDYPSLNPCPTTSVSYGQVRDYKITIGSVAPACTGTPNAGITASTPTSNCTTFNPRLFSIGSSPAFTGLSYQWQSSTTSPTAGFSNISGATGQGYVATISALGPVYYRRVTTCGAASATSIVTSDTLNPPPATSGPNNVCIGATISLTNTITGGTWTSSNTAQATVGSSSGIVTGVAAGTPTITYTTQGGCIATYVITVNASPAAIGGTMVVCPAAVVTLTDASSGGTWSSSDVTLATVGSLTGVVTGVSGGNPVITYTLPTGCYSTATITVQALAPITGVPSMCLGYSTSLTDATPGGVWSSSNTSVATVGSTGVVTSVSIGSTTISYTVASLGCSATITAFVTNAPTAFTVTGGGGMCVGSTTGVTVGVGSSNSGISYQLYNGATPVGTPITGAGFPFTFPAVFTAGTYGVVANPGTACALAGTGTVAVVVNPLPTAYTVSGGGAYCSGTGGVRVFLNASQIGVNYQLFVNTGSGATPVGGVVPGTSASLDFGYQTTAGTYTVGALNTTTGCASNMANSVTISINSLPTAYNVTGGGSYCTGGTGVAVGLNNSSSGVNYQLLIGGVPVIGAVLAGTGSALTYGLITVPGVYTIQATNTTTGCIAMMNGSATISVNSLPTVYTMTGGGAYCAGTTVGVSIGLNGSQTGVNYQLYRGTTSLGSGGLVAGTGGSILFPNQTVAGSYTVVATNTTTLCTSNMFGSASVTINPQPTAFTITAPYGNSYCVGGTGVNLTLSSSEVGVTYQLLNGATVVGAAAGTGSSISFGLFTSAGIYTVVGTYTATGCVGPMSGSVTLIVNPLPTAYNVTVTGGGAYCAGGTGQTVGLSGSQSGVTYQLYLGGVAVTGSGATVSGTGSAINFGLRTVAGSYSVVATNATTGCIRNMTGSAIIAINPTPVAYTVTGGGGYCTGSGGAPIGLSGSDLGINYQLFNGVTAVGSPIPGTGSALSFGLIPTTGTSYNVVATNTSTSCTSGMSGVLTVTVNALPTAYNVTGGGNYCIGGSGVAIGLANSATGVNYQLYRGIVAVGSPVAGSGSAISFGSQTVVGSYTVLATDATTGCSKNMIGSTTVGTNPLPAVFTVTGGGNYCSGGTGVDVTLNGSVTGTDYQLYLGGATIGSPVAGTGGILNFGAQTAAGSYTVVALNTSTGCMNNMAGSATVSISSLPAAYAITGGGNYCTGGAGVVVGLSGSATGILYQLNVGTTAAGAPVAGTGGPISFGMQTTGGSYTVLATNTTTGCSVNMTGTASVVVTPLPTAYSVTGGGNYCPGSGGVAVGVSSSNTGITYQLYRGATAVGAPVAGTGTAISFGLQTTAGTYTVVATNISAGCSATMTGSVSVGVSPLPSIYNVTGGGNYCPAGTGVNVGVSGSSIGVNYQLYLGSTSTGSPVAGTGSSLSFGLQTGTGTYTIKATDATTGCSVNMSGTAVIGISPLPTAHTITGGGNYCTGGTGVHVGLASSTAGVNYQLYNGVTLTGTPMAGTGSSLDFGLQMATGTYTIIGTSSSTTCTNTMAGSVTVGVAPLPTAYSVTGGGNYCSGGTGANVMLSGSDMGIDYQLYVGTSPVGSPIPGTAGMLDWGPQTASGTYTVVAMNTTTCTNNMTGSAVITIDPLPTAFNVTGGGNYCSGGAGVHVTLSGSEVGIQYQLMMGSTTVGAPIAGTGFDLDFGLQTAVGNYTISATNPATTCTNDMSGSVNVGVNSLPTSYTVSGSGSSYCAGGAGINVALSGSDAGTNYQLYNGLTAVGGPTSGTGVALNFGYLTATGTYTVKAVNATTGCANIMAGAASITISPAPVAFSVVGGGSYCNGGTGLNIGISSSNVGVSYQLYNGSAIVGSPVTGTGTALNFGPQTAAGIYTVKATNLSTTCMNTMAGSATVAVNPLPASFVVGGGGNYCVGGVGAPVTLGGSTLGITYQLKKDGIPTGTAIAGTGLPINFGLQTAAGTYTVRATNGTTSCATDMTGTAVITMGALPAVHAVTGGGNYCPGGSGVHIGLGSSSSGISYQLYKGTTAVGSAVIGSGATIDFGAQTAAGTYTVVATNVATGCTNNMSGSVVVGISSLPAVHNVVGGGAYCAGGAGARIGLSNSTVGISYQAYNLATPAGSPVIGTGGALDLGPRPLAGTYTVIATDPSTSCSNTMAGSASVSITPVVSPAVTMSTGVGDTVCAGSMTTFTAMAVNGGSAPSYQWTVNGSPVGMGSAYSYLPANGDVVAVSLTSSAACAVPAVASTSKAITVNNSQMPSVAVAATPGTNVCQGTLVTFAATPVFGGSAPTYSWIVNGVNTSSLPTYSYTPANGDVVYCVMTSNYRCRLANNANSTHLTMSVDLPVVPAVTISANPGVNIAAGQALILTASVTNAGPTPGFQWFVNGTAVTGANSPTYASSSFVNGDSVSCEVTSSGGCAGVKGSDAVTVRVSGVGVKTITANSDVKLVPNPNKGIFTVKGSLGITSDEDVTIEVTNMVGQTVYNTVVSSHNGDINETIQLSKGIANGMYVLTLRSDNVSKVFHIVVEQ